jgi:hypothetical protein
MAGRISGGRTLRTPERRDVILRNLRVGGTRTASAGLADLSYDTFARWLRSDASFAHDVIVAEAMAEARFATVVTDDALGRAAQYDDRGRVIREEVKPNVDSAKWWLERRRIHEYGRRISLDVRTVIERVAAENGLDAAELIREAEALLAEHADSNRR